MAPLDDEQAGEILARYVEALKKADDPSTVNFVAITAAETDELAPVMQTAAQVAQALAEERSGDAAKEATRRKFRDRAATLAREAAAREAAHRPVPAPAPARAPQAGPRWLRFPQVIGGLGWACAVLLAVLLVVPRSTPRTGTPRLPLSHSEVHNGVGALIRNQVPLEHTRLMWAHLVGCDACFGVYQQKWREFHGMAAVPPEMLMWRSMRSDVTSQDAPFGETRFAEKYR